MNDMIKSVLTACSIAIFFSLLLSCSGNETKTPDVQTVANSVTEVQNVDTVSTSHASDNQNVAPESETIDSALYRSWIVDDDPVLKECKADDSYLWKLDRIESVDYSPINDSVRKKLSQITMGLTYG